jgi:hypothetical protein
LTTGRFTDDLFRDRDGLKRGCFSLSMYGLHFGAQTAITGVTVQTHRFFMGIVSGDTSQGKPCVEDR